MLIAAHTIRAWMARVILSISCICLIIVQSPHKFYQFANLHIASFTHRTSSVTKAPANGFAHYSNEKGTEFHSLDKRFYSNQAFVLPPPFATMQTPLQAINRISFVYTAIAFNSIQYTTALRGPPVA